MRMPRCESETDVGGRRTARLRDRRDRHQPQRLRRDRQAAHRRRRAGRLRRGQVPEAHARAVRAARPVGHRARHALGAHDLHRLPPARSSSASASTRAIDGYCRERGILWFASCWDEPSVDFIERFAPPCYKVASASLTDLDLLRAMKRRPGGPLIISTGMSTHGGDRRAGRTPLGRTRLLVAHSTSTYPCPVERAQPAHDRHPHGAASRVPDRLLGPRGRPGADLGGGRPGRHASSSATSPSIAPCGAATRRPRSRSAASCGWSRNIRDVERALGDGVKRVYASELRADRRKLRRVSPRPRRPREAGMP